MKYYLFAFFCLIQVGAVATNIEVENILNYLNTESNNVDIYKYNINMDEGMAIILLHDTIYSPCDGEVFFIDKSPLSNWDHECSYLWKTNGQFIELAATQPPLHMQNWEKIHKNNIETLFLQHPNTSLFHRKVTNNHQSSTHYEFTKNKYAVIISGGANVYNNHVRYWNDCAFIYKVLREKYKYEKANIFVAVSDGTNPDIDRHFPNDTYDSSPLDLDEDGQDDIAYPATTNALQSIFNALSLRLTKNDELFIFITDHGYRKDNHSYINLWNNTSIRDDEFANLVKSIQAKSISILMEQCNSGGFISFLDTTNINIATACSANEYSHSMNNFMYNEFSYYWTSAMLGYDLLQDLYVDADFNQDGSISMYEAFMYANALDQQIETPQYLSNPSSIGEETTLKGKILSIIGPDSFCHSAQYYVENVPDFAELQWIRTGLQNANQDWINIIDSTNTTMPITKLAITNLLSDTVTVIPGKNLGIKQDGSLGLITYTGEAELSPRIIYDGEVVNLSKRIYIQERVDPEIIATLTIAPDLDLSPDHLLLGFTYYFKSGLYPNENELQWTIITEEDTLTSVGIHSPTILAGDNEIIVTVYNPNEQGCTESSTNSRIYTTMEYIGMDFANPVDDIVEIQVAHKLPTNTMSRSVLVTEPILYEGEFEVELWDMYRGKLRTMKGRDGHIQMLLQGIASGNYMLRLIINGQQVDSKPLMVR